MDGYTAEIEQIKKTLAVNPRGMTVLNVSKELNISRNSAAKYLDILLVSGQVEMKNVGPAKLYFLSQRIPASALINFCSDPMLVLDSESKVIQINDPLLTLIGAKREDVLNKHIEDPLFPFSSDLKLLSLIKGAFAGNRHVEACDLSMNEKNLHFNVEMIPSVLDNGIPGIAIIMHNLTEDKEMEQKLDKYRKLLDDLIKEPTQNQKEHLNEYSDEVVNLRKEYEESRRREARNQAILNAMPDLIVTIKSDGTFLDFIESNEDILYAPSSELIGRKVTETFPENVSGPSMSCIEQALQTNKMQTFQYQLQIKNDLIDFEARIVASGKDEVIAIITDITERKHAENELKLLNEQLQLKYEMEQLLAQVAFMFVSSSDINTVILDTLEKIGKICKATRSYVFQFRENGTIADNTYEWCSEGIGSIKSHLQNVSMKIFPWFANKFTNNKLIHIKDLSVLTEESSAERDILESYNIKSLIVIPIYANNELFGVFGLDNALTTEKWSEKDIDFLQTISIVIGTGIERKQMEDSLRENEARLSAAQYIARLGNWEWDIVNNDVRWSDAVYLIFGYNPQEFRGKEVILDPVHPDDRIFVQENLNKAICENKPYSVEHRIILPDGSERFVHVQAKTVYNELGQAVKMIGTVQDITERKRTETILKENEEKFRTIFENANDAIYLVRTNLQFIEVNQRACEQLGYSRSELLKLTPKDIDAFDAAAKLHDRFNQLLQNGHIMFETILLRKDRSVFPVEISLQVVDYMGDKAILGISRNISERKKAESDLRASEEKFKAIFENANDAILVSDLTGRYLEVNKMACEQLGYSRSELLQMLPQDLSARDDASEVAKARIDQLLQDESMRFETILVRKDGFTFPVEISLKVIDYMGDKAILSILRDISKFKQIEKDIY